MGANPLAGAHGLLPNNGWPASDPAFDAACYHVQELSRLVWAHLEKGQLSESLLRAIQKQLGRKLGSLSRLDRFQARNVQGGPEDLRRRLCFVVCVLGLGKGDIPDFAAHVGDTEWGKYGPEFVSPPPALGGRHPDAKEIAERF